jgi:hypothetical protein
MARSAYLTAPLKPDTIPPEVPHIGAIKRENGFKIGRSTRSLGSLGDV